MMIRASFATLVLGAVLASGAVQAAELDVCRLSSTAEIRMAVGSAPKVSEPEEPFDHDGSRQWACTHEMGGLTLRMDVTRMPTPREAANMVSLLSEMPMFGNSLIKMKPATGLGDQAVWAQEPGTIAWVTANGRYLLSVAVIGDGDMNRLRDPLQRLAAAALGKLPRQ